MTAEQAKARIKARDKVRHSTPVYKARVNARNATPEYRARAKAHRATPEQKARLKVWRATSEAKTQDKVRHATPEVKSRCTSPEGRARNLVSIYKTPIEIPNRPVPAHCECCGDIATIIHLDHCHASGRFRGWVCPSCNTGMRRNATPAWHRLVARYLEHPFTPGLVQWAYPSKRRVVV
jgi:hypothetical protein